MPTYNRNFQLSINDIDLIEEALRARGRELCTMRRALSEENPADMRSIQVIEQDQRQGERDDGAHLGRNPTGAGQMADRRPMKV